MHAPRAAHPSWGMITLLAAMSAFGALSIDMYLPAMPTIGQALNAAPADVQRSLSSFLAGLAIGQVLYGPWSDRSGRRPPILAGIVLYIVASAACALANSAELLIIGRFVQGFGACAALVVSRAFIRDTYGHQETARILSLIMLVFGVVPIVAPILGALVLTIADWHMIFWLLTGFGVILFFAVFVALPESRSAETAAQAATETPAQAYWELLKSRRLMGYLLSGAFNGTCLFTYIAASPDLIIGTYGVPPQHFSWIFGTNAVGLVIGSQINRRLLLHYSTDRVAAMATLFALAWGVAMAVAAATGFGGMWGVLVPLFLVMSTYGFLAANTTAGALSVDPVRAGSISGLSGLLSFGIAAVGTALLGFFHVDGSALPMAGGMLAALTLAAAALFLLALSGRKSAS
ncbi:multidrug effflux MFS transporter [Sphingoaurantiacus capsulatus]|uniref:Bcr/CflA family efflux transporter n=1 Tax=Sphingoaurantiacus capsulatus TaxID=1771310 RepID=A0ABV7XAB9_9SPHN